MTLPNKRQLQREGTLEVIYLTVNELVMEKGFEDMHIKDICERAGISTGAFYHHFSSKQDILFERYHATNEYVRTLYEESLRDMEPTEALKKLVETMTEYTRTRVPGVLSSYLEAHLHNAAQWRERDGVAYADVVVWLLAAGQKSGRLRMAGDAQETGKLFEIYLQGIMGLQCMSGGAFLETSRPETAMCAWVETLRL